jgi:hypothetical protein
MPAENLTHAEVRSATSAASSPIPFLHDDASTVSANSFGVWFAAAVAIALVLWWFTRRKGPRHLGPFRLPGGPRAPASLALVSRLQLAPQASLHVVRWHGDEWLMGCDAQGLTVLSRQTRSAAQARASAGVDATANGDGLDEHAPA